MADLRGGDFPPSWRKVIYVLLTKPPPNNPALISERREIALMAQDMKLIMHMVRATAYRLITGRLRSEQCGWLPGYGTVDAGLPLAAVIQQAQRLQQSIWILYVDLATFFPRIDREALTVAEVLVGLPPQVIELVGQIYGAGRAVAAEAVECQFDTAIGLSASFRNHMGALMGEVLSPDRAKIILNSILWAIKLHVHGIQLFGFGAQGDPRLFSWGHLTSTLERHLRGRQRYLGEAFMFISSLLQGDKQPGENWRWVNSPETWDPLHECWPHFRTLESIALFEPEQRGGLGIEPAPKLLEARIRVAGQLYTWGVMHEGSRLMSFHNLVGEDQRDTDLYARRWVARG